MALKKTSQVLNIGASVVEAGPNTFTETEVTLPLNTLDREVFVVTDVYVDSNNPSEVALTTTAVHLQVTKTAQPAMTTIADPQLIASSRYSLYGGVGEFSPIMEEFPQVNSTGTAADHLAIIATPNFFLGIEGANNLNPRAGNARISGYRAKATADVYAALVTEELNA